MRATFGQRLRAAMEQQGLHPAALARKANTTEATISNWLRDAVQPDHVKAVQLFRVADALEASPRSLLLGIDDLSTSLQAAPVAASQPPQQEHLTLAIQLVTEVLEEIGRRLPPSKQAEAIQLALELLEEGLPQAKVLRFVRAAVA